MLWESRCFDCENGIVRHCELLRPLSCILPVLPSLLMRKSNRGECGRRNGFRPESNAGTGTNHAGSQYFLLYWLLYGHTGSSGIHTVLQGAPQSRSRFSADEWIRFPGGKGTAGADDKHPEKRCGADRSDLFRK